LLIKIFSFKKIEKRTESLKPRQKPGKKPKHSLINSVSTENTSSSLTIQLQEDVLNFELQKINLLKERLELEKQLLEIEEKRKSL
jgi:hypothetical protein